MLASSAGSRAPPAGGGGGSANVPCEELGVLSGGSARTQLSLSGGRCLGARERERESRKRSIRRVRARPQATAQLPVRRAHAPLSRSAPGGEQSRLCMRRERSPLLQPPSPWIDKLLTGCEERGIGAWRKCSPQRIRPERLLLLPTAAQPPSPPCWIAFLPWTRGAAIFPVGSSVTHDGADGSRGAEPGM